VTVAVVPNNSNQTVGGTFQVAVLVSGAQDVTALPMQIHFDPHVLQLVNVDTGDFLAKGLTDGQQVTQSHRDDGNGLVAVQVARPAGEKGVNGSGNVATLTFKAAAPGDSLITFVKVGAKNSADTAIPANGSQALVHVK
jgi:general secretion pathway protein D